MTILSHPSLTGINSGSGLSGSTAWHDGFRFRQYLKSAKEDGENLSDLRELSFMKIQYEKPPAASIVLRYRNGLFPTRNRANRFRKSRRRQQGRKQSFSACLLSGQPKAEMSDKSPIAPTTRPRPSPRTIPGITKRQLADAMARLFKSNKIRVEKYGRNHHRIVNT